MRFTPEQRTKILHFRMGELEIESVCELARLAGLDRSNVHHFMHGNAAALGLSSRARLAVALHMTQEELAELCDETVIVVAVGIDLNALVEDTANRERLATQLAIRREREGKAHAEPG